MTATLIDGKAFAEGLRGRIAGAVAGLKGQGVTPALAVVLVGEDPASQVYVRNKGRQTEEAGMRSIEHRLPASTRQEDLLALVQRLNADPGGGRHPGATAPARRPRPAARHRSARSE
jgi:methylenetetrahydrofolate dehydrogenase (NADP+)/methenyltetrahydrofolate cyclohydrolase